MDFGEFLEKQAVIIDNRIAVVLNGIIKEAQKADGSLEKIFKRFEEASKDGKRVRGALVLLGYKIGGGKDFKNVLDAAAAYEIFQTAILAQDDVIDQSLLRRGRASLHQSLGGDHRAVSQTICLADIGVFSAYRLLSGLKIEDALKTRAINFFSQTLTQTVLGEMLDIESAFTRDENKIEDVLKISLLKTARYTVSGPLMLGAVLGGGDMNLLKRIQEFGDNLGIGYQIQDDILGVFGDERIIGKSTDSDIKERKATVLITYAQKSGTREHRQILGKYYGNENIDAKGVEEVRRVFKETGALKYSQSLADKYFTEARKALKGTSEDLLYSLVDYIKGRKK